MLKCYGTARRNQVVKRLRELSAKRRGNRFAVTLKEHSEINQKNTGDCQDNREEQRVLEDAIGQVSQIAEHAERAKDQEHPLTEEDRHDDHRDIDQAARTSLPRHPSIIESPPQNARTPKK